MDKDKKDPKEIVQKRTFEASRNAYLLERDIDYNTDLVLDDLFPDTLFHGSHRVIPNDFARCSLFTTRHPKEARLTFTQHEIFHTSNNVSILYTGQELRALDDELIWMQLVYYCTKSPLGNYVTFKIRDLLKDIGWSTTGFYYHRVRESLSRMKATEILIKNKKQFGLSAGISLINNYIALDETGSKEPTTYSISIDKNIIILFAGNTFTNVPWEKYKKLSTTTRRLADWIFSHKYPNPMDINIFLQLCGSNRVNSPSKTQIQAAKRCCKELLEFEMVKDAFVNKGKIIVTR